MSLISGPTLQPLLFSQQFRDTCTTLVHNSKANKMFLVSTEGDCEIAALCESQCTSGVVCILKRIIGGYNGGLLDTHLVQYENITFAQEKQGAIEHHR